MMSYKIANSIEAKGKSVVPDSLFNAITRVLTTAGYMERQILIMK
jgi:hypothetical protein